MIRRSDLDPYGILSQGKKNLQNQASVSTLAMVLMTRVSKNSSFTITAITVSDLAPSRRHSYVRTWAWMMKLQNRTLLHVVITCRMLTWCKIFILWESRTETILFSYCKTWRLIQESITLHSYRNNIILFSLFVLYGVFLFFFTKVCLIQLSLSYFDNSLLHCDSMTWITSQLKPRR